MSQPRLGKSNIRRHLHNLLKFSDSFIEQPFLFASQCKEEGREKRVGKQLPRFLALFGRLIVFSRKQVVPSQVSISKKVERVKFEKSLTLIEGIFRAALCR